MLHWLPPLPLLLQGQGSCSGVGKLEQTSLPVRGFPGRVVAEKPVTVLVTVGEVIVQNVPRGGERLEGVSYLLALASLLVQTL